MGREITISLTDGLMDDYRRAAAGHGRTLEAELSAALAAARPQSAHKDVAALLRLSDEALAMTPPDGPPIGSDSTLMIRWDRDTAGGDWIDDGWSDDTGR